MGLDLIIGMGSSFSLPRDLWDYLEDFGMTSLAQARNYSPDARSYWLSAADLDLGGEWYLLWNSYVIGLEYGRIRLRPQPDNLLWSYKSYSRSISVATAYDCISTHHMDPLSNSSFILQFLWKINIPEKIRCFIWLLIMNKVLTWDQLISRGFQGPSICFLCKNGEDSAQHLFLDCLFTKRAFEVIFEHFGIHSFFKDYVRLYLKHWFRSHTIDSVVLYLPLFIFWTIWKHRNGCIFEEKHPFFMLSFSRQNLSCTSLPCLKRRKKTESLVCLH